MTVLLNDRYKKHVKKNIGIKMEIQFVKWDKLQQKELSYVSSICYLKLLWTMEGRGRWNWCQSKSKNKSGKYAPQAKNHSNEES